MSKYNYLGGYSPKRKSQDALDKEGNPNPEYNSYARGFGEKLGVFPEHKHDNVLASRGLPRAYFYQSGGDELYNKTGQILDLNPEYVELGEKVEPLSNIVRYLQKM